MTRKSDCAPASEEGHELESDWTTEELDDIQKRTLTAVTIPVNVEIKGDNRVLNLEEAKKYLENAWPIVLMDCVCRVERKNCDFPVNVCLRLNERGEKALASEELKILNPRKVTVEEGLAVLDQTHKAGLVHMALAVDQEGINEICSCCSCCCVVLAAARRYGHPRLVLTFTAVATTDSSRCISCGVCVERCQFGARDLVNGEVVFDPELCAGCGLCVSTCPAEAITLRKKSI
jgi:NAD-dependent dihydropyrimidine dehydrogenase PreA subunit